MDLLLSDILYTIWHLWHLLHNTIIFHSFAVASAAAWCCWRWCCDIAIVVVLLVVCIAVIIAALFIRTLLCSSPFSGFNYYIIHFAVYSSQPSTLSFPFPSYGKKPQCCLEINEEKWKRLQSSTPNPFKSAYFTHYFRVRMKWKTWKKIALIKKKIQNDISAKYYTIQNERNRQQLLQHNNKRTHQSNKSRVVRKSQYGTTSHESVVNIFWPVKLHDIMMDINISWH